MAPLLFICWRPYTAIHSIYMIHIPPGALPLGLESLSRPLQAAFPEVFSERASELAEAERWPELSSDLFLEIERRE